MPEARASGAQYCRLHDHAAPAPGLGATADDALDYGEQFERMEAQRVMADNPDSLPYFNAHKSMQHTLVKGGKAKQHVLLKTKRLHR